VPRCCLAVFRVGRPARTAWLLVSFAPLADVAFFWHTFIGEQLWQTLIVLVSTVGLAALSAVVVRCLLRIAKPGGALDQLICCPLSPKGRRRLSQRTAAVLSICFVVAFAVAATGQVLKAKRLSPSSPWLQALNVLPMLWLLFAWLPCVFAWLATLALAHTICAEEIANLKQLVRTTAAGGDDWSSRVIGSARRLVDTSLRALNKGWGFSLSVTAAFFALFALLFLVEGSVLGRAPDTSPLTRHTLPSDLPAELMVVFSLVSAAFALTPLVVPTRIARGCDHILKEVSKKQLALLGSTETQAQAHTVGLLSEALRSHPHFGMSVLGITVTPTLLTKLLSLILPTYVVLGRFAQGGGVV